jgi:D-cysteine desulfhydrase
MSLQNLTRFPRLEFIGAPTPLEYLPRFSDYLGAIFLLSVMT